MAKRVIVKGPIGTPILLDTDRATAIEFYDEQGNLCAVFGKVINENFWAFATKKDKDWNETLTLLGVTFDKVPIHR
jgi:hypothetical protein